MTAVIAVAACCAAFVVALLGAGVWRDPCARDLTTPSPRVDEVERRARRRLAATWAGVVIIVPLLAVVAGPLLAALLLTVLAVRRELRRRRHVTRQRARVVNCFPDLVEMVALAVRAGCTPLHAFATIEDLVDPSVAGSVRAVGARVEAGERFADSVAALPAALGPVAQPLASMLALADRYGTPLVPALDRLADEARQQRRRNAEAAARQLPVRLAFPLVGCTLPSFVLLAIVPLLAGTFSSLHALGPT